MLLVCLAEAVAAQAPEPYPTDSPFAGMYQVDGVTTSNDEYAVWFFWGPDAWELRYAGRAPFSGGGDLLVGIQFACRADGSALGYMGGRPLVADLMLPMHPDDPDVPNVFNPLYWWRGLTGREWIRTPVRVLHGGAGGYRATLVRHTIDYSFARPELRVGLRAAAALRELARGGALALSVEGAGNRFALSFPGAGASVRRVAAAMLRHCPS